MVTKQQYQHSLSMLSVLDMDNDEIEYHRHLEIALDYDSENGRYCGNQMINYSLVSRFQVERPQRIKGNVLCISEVLTIE